MDASWWKYHPSDQPGWSYELRRLYPVRRNDREGVGDTIFSVSKRQFRTEVREATAPFWSRPCIGLAPVRTARQHDDRLGCYQFSYHHNVRSDGQNRLSRDSVTVGVSF